MRCGLTSTRTASGRLLWACPFFFPVGMAKTAARISSRSALRARVSVTSFLENDAPVAAVTSFLENDAPDQWRLVSTAERAALAQRVCWNQPHGTGLPGER